MCTLYGPLIKFIYILKQIVLKNTILQAVYKAQLNKACVFCRKIKRIVITDSNIIYRSALSALDIVAVRKPSSASSSGSKAGRLPRLSYQEIYRKNWRRQKKIRERYGYIQVLPLASR